MAEIVHPGTYKRLFRYLAFFVRIREETFEQRLKEKLKARYYFHPALLQEEDCVGRYAHYVASGMVQVFYHDEARGEVTFRLFKAGEIALIEDSFMNQQPSSSALLACADTLLLSISHSDLEQIYLEFPRVRELTLKIIASHNEKDRERDALFQLPGAERVIRFYSLYPELLGPFRTRKVKMKDRHIASYLHLSEITFSKLKRRYVARLD